MKASSVPFLGKKRGLFLCTDHWEYFLDRQPFSGCLRAPGANGGGIPRHRGRSVLLEMVLVTLRGSLPGRARRIRVFFNRQQELALSINLLAHPDQLKLLEKWPNIPPWLNFRNLFVESAERVFQGTSG